MNEGWKFGHHEKRRGIINQWLEEWKTQTAQNIIINFCTDFWDPIRFLSCVAVAKDLTKLKEIEKRVLNKKYNGEDNVVLAEQKAFQIISDISRIYAYKKAWYGNHGNRLCARKVKK